MDREQRAGAITLIYVALVLGLSVGTNIGIHQVCKEKDRLITILAESKNLSNPRVQEVLPKNLAKIEDIKR